jgi:diacylglycerol kinase family enzyme
VNITINGQSLEQEITLLAMCNGKYYGNGIPIAPNACLNNNLLNICLADKISKAKIPFLFNGLMKMRHEEYPFVHVQTTDNITVTSDELLACNIDGEIVRDNKFDVSIDGNVKVIKPTKSH